MIIIFPFSLSRLIISKLLLLFSSAQRIYFLIFHVLSGIIKFNLISMFAISYCRKNGETGEMISRKRWADVWENHKKCYDLPDHQCFFVLVGAREALKVILWWEGGTGSPGNLLVLVTCCWSSHTHLFI